MNIRVLLPLIAGLAAGGAGGYLLGRGGAVEPSPPAKAAALPVKKVEPGAVLPESAVLAALRPLLGDGPLTADNAGGRIEKALSEPDASRRNAAVALLLLSMDAGNARAVLQGFKDITIKTGRTNDEEWFRMLSRFGQVLGVEGIKELMVHKSDARAAMEGLASMDPAAARAALGMIDPNDRELRDAWMKGLAVKDPVSAFSLIISGEEADANSVAVMKLAIQSLGLDGTGDALRKVLGDGDQDKETLSRFQQLFEPLTDTMFNKHWHAGTVDKMQGWLEQQKGQPHITGAIIAHGVKDGILSGNAAGALDWLGRMNEGQTGVPVGGKEIQEIFWREPQILSDVDEATFQRSLTAMPENAQTMLALGLAMKKINPERSAKIMAFGNSLLAAEQAATQNPVR